MNRRSVISILCGLSLALAAAPAAAQTPGQGGYGPTPIPLPPAHHHSSPPDATRTVAVKRLPFTGVDVRILALAGITLLGTGFGLRRRTRPQTE